MDTADDTWDQLLRRASALRRRFGDQPDGPQSTWSLVNRAAQRFGDGAVPSGVDPAHDAALWSRAMTSVLVDLYRRRAVRDRELGTAVPLRDTESGAERDVAEAAADTETLRLIDVALRELAAFDERKAALIAHRYVEGLSWQEVGRRVGLSETGVRRQWALAVAWLRRELKRRGVEGLDGAPEDT